MTAEDDSFVRRTGELGVVRERFDELSLLVGAYEGPEHRLVAANEAFRQSAAAPEPIGMTFRELFPDFEAQRILAVIDRTYATGERQVAREWRVQVDPDQTGDAQESFVDFVMEPHFDSSGAVTGVTAYGVDVTAQVVNRRAQEQRTADVQTRYERARDVVTELQAALLPTALPVLPQARIAARYLVAAEDRSAGGDWFDAIPLPDGTVVLVVGDVVGHGVAASAAMGQLRAVLMNALFTTDDLLAVLKQVDAFATRVRALNAATLAVLRLDPRTGDFQYSRCGHPPPLLIHADGTTAFLDGPAAGPLGVGRTPALSTGHLEPDDLVLLYSDGLVERPNRTLTESTAELAVVAADAAMNRVLPKGAADSAAERVCQLTVELLTRTGYRDDVTALAVQRVATSAPRLKTQVVAALTELPTARRAVRQWLSGVVAGRHDHDVLELAVNELVTNAVDHAYPTGMPGAVQITAELLPDGICEFRVADEGHWKPPSSTVSHRGRGLMLCERLIDEVTVAHPPQQVGEPVGARGTIVTLRHRVHQPATLANDSESGAPAGQALPVFRTEILTGEDSPVVRVSGAVDVTNSVDFARDLFTASRGGVLPLTVDLSGVTHLASAGVRVLYEAVEQLAAHQQVPAFVTPADSPAALVLDLVDLPHTAVASD